MLPFLPVPQGFDCMFTGLKVSFNGMRQRILKWQSDCDSIECIDMRMFDTNDSIHSPYPLELPEITIMVSSGVQAVTNGKVVSEKTFYIVMCKFLYYLLLHMSGLRL